VNHPYIPNSNEVVKKQMLDIIKTGSVDDLFKDIPASIRSKASITIPSTMSEVDVKRRIERLLANNISSRDMLSFIGAGVWHHHVPAVVDSILSRGEFLTSYTSYQPEVSQGMLQALFEYQSMICELTGMMYSNSSVYDWSTALGEAARLTARVTHRDEFIVPHFISPERFSTLRTFCDPVDIKLVEVKQDARTGFIDQADFTRKLSDKTAGVYVEYPSFLGFVDESYDEIASLAHMKGALFVVGVEPISLGALKPPGDFGADVVVGEGQPLGSHMNYGGPLLGIFACSGESLLRQMPGRIIGRTTTLDGKQDAYCMALQTREQHIRREKATSNICTNEALLALAASIYLSLLGPGGLGNLCSIILDRSRYAMNQLQQVRSIRTPVFDSFHFMEFTVNFDKSDKKVSEVNKELLKAGIQGGLDLSKYFPELGQTALYCFTELHSHDDVDMLRDTLQRILVV